jgi:hypothetical protein
MKQSSGFLFHKHLPGEVPMMKQLKNAVITGCMVLVTFGSAMAIDITPFSNQGSIRLEFGYVPKAEQLGGLEVSFTVRPEVAVSAISLSPAQSGPWSQIRPELVQTGNAVTISDITPSIMNCSDSVKYAMFSVVIEFTDTAATVQTVDKIIDSMRVKQAISVNGEALQGTGLAWNAIVPVKPGTGAAPTPQIGFRHVSRSYVLSFNLAAKTKVTASVFDGMGRRVTTLFDKVLPGGIHDVRWGGTDASGKTVTAGMYFIQLRIGNFTYNKKVSHVL